MIAATKVSANAIRLAPLLMARGYPNRSLSSGQEEGAAFAAPSTVRVLSRESVLCGRQRMPSWTTATVLP
jgi:hypothetical protein